MTTSNTNSKQSIEALKKVAHINNFRFKKNRHFLKSRQEAIAIKPEKSDFTSLDPDYLINCINVLDKGDITLCCLKNRNWGKEARLYNVTDNKLVEWSKNDSYSEYKKASLEENIIYYLNDNDTYAWFSVVLDRNKKVKLTIYS